MYDVCLGFGSYFAWGWLFSGSYLPGDVDFAWGFARGGFDWDCDSEGFLGIDPCKKRICDDPRQYEVCHS